MRRWRAARRAVSLLPLALSLLLPLSCCSACGAEVGARAAGALRFTAIPDRDTTELAEKFAPLAEHLARELGIAVEYVPSSDYQASVEMFKTGDVELAWFGGLTGVQARRAVPGSRAIAQGRIDAAFESCFVVHSSTGIERSGEFPLALEGKRFTFGSESSTSGRLMPEHFIRLHTGRSPEEFFGRPNAYSGSHDQTAVLVESGAFEAGALSRERYDALVAQGKLDPLRCRIAWVTPEYRDYNWTAHPSIDARFGAGTTLRIAAALLALREPELLGALGRPEGLIPAENGDYEPLEALAAELGFL